MRLATTLLCAATVGAGICAVVPSISKAQASPAPSPSASVSVDTKDFAYAPATIAVPAGSTVVFTNSDSTAHTITAEDGSFDSKNMDQNQTWSHVFAHAGTYEYVCAYHAFMHGTVLVK